MATTGLKDMKNKGAQIDSIVQADIQPILDIFGASDGGVSFVRFRHEIAPALYSSSEPEDVQLQLVIRRFSKLCELILENKM